MNRLKALLTNHDGREQRLGTDRRAHHYVLEKARALATIGRGQKEGLAAGFAVDGRTCLVTGALNGAACATLGHFCGGLTLRGVVDQLTKLVIQ